MGVCILKNWTAFQRRSASDGTVHEHLVGEVYGHPARPDGTVVTTSHVIRRDGQVAITASGTRYELDGNGADADATWAGHQPG